MTNQKVMVYKGMESRPFDIASGARIAAVRNQLSSAGFIGADTDEEAWRFFIYDSKSTEFTDAILGKEVEPLVPIDGMFGPGRQLYLTNILKGRNPDLMGIGTDRFFDRFMGCRVTLNMADESAAAINQGKFQPLHLKHVRPSSKNVSGFYDNVVVCERGSAITFEISSWGSAGFFFNIKPDAGRPIADGLYLLFGEHQDYVGGAGLWRYQDEAKQIVVDSVQSMQIPTGQWVDYQRVAVRTYRVTSYYDEGQRRTYQSNTQPQSVLEESQAPRAVARANILPGDAITPGTVKPGETSGQAIGGGVRDIKADPTPLGEVVFYFFVFNSRADAEKVIGQINAPNPHVWE